MASNVRPRFSISGTVFIFFSLSHSAPMSHKALCLDVDNGTEPFKHIEIQPVVIFSVLDQYIRRQQKEDDRVIGTLLGRVEEGAVLVSNCFTVPHAEDNNGVYIKPTTLDFLRNMCKLYGEVNPDEQIVGWYDPWCP